MVLEGSDDNTDGMNQSVNTVYSIIYVWTYYYVLLHVHVLYEYDSNKCTWNFCSLTLFLVVTIFLPLDTQTDTDNLRSPNAFTVLVLLYDSIKYHQQLLWIPQKDKHFLHTAAILMRFFISTLKTAKIKWQRKHLYYHS